MTKTPNRTRPLDRDGDGRDGGSLPGNRTAPMAQTENPAETPAAEGEQPVVDDLADARTTPGDSAEKLEASGREVDEANAEAGVKITSIPGGEPNRFKVEGLNDALAAIAEAEPELVEQALSDAEDAADQTDTFTAEEIAAGQTPVIQAEGEEAAVAADVATAIPADDPLVQIETETAPIAVRERELRLLLENRRLYKSPEGYSSNYGAPYVDEATVQGWIAAGLADDEPTAGTWGGVKPTHEARRQLGLILHGSAD